MTRSWTETKLKYRLCYLNRNEIKRNLSHLLTASGFAGTVWSTVNGLCCGRGEAEGVVVSASGTGGSDNTGTTSLPEPSIFLLITLTGLFICFSSTTVPFVSVLAIMFLFMPTFLLTNIFLRRSAEPVALSSKMITRRTLCRYLMWCNMVITPVCLLHKCHGVWHWDQW